MTAFADLVDRYWLWLNCPCGHSVRLDPAVLAARYGGQADSKGLVRRSRCTRCGRKGPTTTIAPMHAPGMISWDPKVYGVVGQKYLPNSGGGRGPGGA